MSCFGKERRFHIGWHSRKRRNDNELNEFFFENISKENSPKTSSRRKICMRSAQDEAVFSVRFIKAPICVFMTHPLMFAHRHDGQCIKVKWRRKNILAATHRTRLMFGAFLDWLWKSGKFSANFFQAAKFDMSFRLERLQAQMHRGAFRWRILFWSCWNLLKEFNFRREKWF